MRSTIVEPLRVLPVFLQVPVPQVLLGEFGVEPSSFVGCEPISERLDAVFVDLSFELDIEPPLHLPHGDGVVSLSSSKLPLYRLSSCWQKW